MENGKFVISLDFELHWGFFDNRPLANCKSQLSNIPTVIEKLLQLSKKYKTSITFATVGFLMANDKDELLEHLPLNKPDYNNKSLNAYTLLSTIAREDYKYYFAKDLVNKIKNDSLHEIGTHTFSHYYCYEKGPDKNDFKADIQSAVAVANNLNIQIKSIVFPRNQVRENYLKVCEDLGIESYRGNCWFNFNNDERKRKFKEYILKILRFFDSYFNISGANSFNMDNYNSKDVKLINIPASRFLRPYHSSLKFMETLKINRIKRGMTKAAKRKEVYHLWWHPHNFANHIDENFKNLAEIFKHYETLNKVYGFESITMDKLAEKYKTS